MKNISLALVLMLTVVVSKNLVGQEDQKYRELVSKSISTTTAEYLPLMANLRLHSMKSGENRQIEELLIQAIQTQDIDVLERTRTRIGELRIQLEAMERLEDRLMAWQKNPQQADQLIKDAQGRLQTILEYQRVNRDPLNAELEELNGKYTSEKVEFLEMVKAHSRETGDTEKTKGYVRQSISGHFQNSRAQFEYQSQEQSKQVRINVSYVRERFPIRRHREGKIRERFEVMSKSSNAAVLRCRNFEVALYGSRGRWTFDELVEIAFDLVDIEKLESYNPAPNSIE